MNQEGSDVTDDREAADAAKVRADAAKTAADAAKTQAEADKAAAEAVKILAEADKARADAAKVQAEVDDMRTPAAVVAKESGYRKTVAEAELAAGTARRTAIGALLPDVGSVSASKLDVTGEQLLWAPIAAHKALERAAAEIKDRLVSALPDSGPTVLVTTDADLVQAETAYQEVTNGIAQLTSAAARVLEELDRKPGGVNDASLGGVSDAIAAIAAALPGVLSLFTADRRVTSKAQSVSDQAAIAAVIGALDPADRSRSFAHATFRLLRASNVYGSLTAVIDTVETIKARRLGIDRDKARAATALAVDQKELDGALAEEAKKAKAGDPVDPQLSEKIVNAARRVDLNKGRIAELDGKLTYIEMLLGSTSGFLDAIKQPSEPGGRSPLDVAVIHERLHKSVDDGTAEFSHVLLLTVEGGSGYQSVSNRPLWFQDKFSTSVDVSLSYMLLHTQSNAIRASGVVTRTASAYGNIGARMTVTVEE